MPFAIVRRDGGFTLIELMVSLAVLAVMVFAAAPSFADFFERYRLRSAVDDTISLLAQARQGAVEEDRNVTVGINTASWCVGARQQPPPAQYQVIPTTPTACDCAGAPASCVVDGEPLLVDGVQRPGITVTTGVPAFTYDSKNGTLANLAVAPTIVFNSSSARYALQVQVSALGQARACVPAGKRPIPGYSSC